MQRADVEEVIDKINYIMELADEDSCCDLLEECMDTLAWIKTQMEVQL